MTTFLDLALRRRSIRKYEARAVEKEKIEQILQAGLASPSSKHLNPWEFVVVTDHDVLCCLSDCKTYGSALLQNSPLGIVVCVDGTGTDTWQCDGSIAALNMLLCAEDLGLGGCWVHIHNRGTKENIEAEAMARKLLNIPERLNVLCIVSIGYKAEEKKSINPDKLQYEKVHWDTYKTES